MERFVLVIDSGVGGISVLNQCIKLMPSENFLYVADTKNAPYGNKSKQSLQKTVLNLVKNYLEEYDIKLILFACNTITATTINFIRSKIKTDIVGIEPAIKPAVEYGDRHILLLSTVATLKHNKMLRKYKHKNLKGVHFLSLKYMAKHIDSNLEDLTKINSYVKRALTKYKKTSINSVVLGCTHYEYIKEHLKFALNNKDLQFFESNLGTARRVKQLLVTNNDLKKEGNGHIMLFETKAYEAMLNKLWNYIVIE